MDKTVEVLARLREERARLAGELAGLDRAIAAIEETTAVPVPEEKTPPARPVAEPEPAPVVIPRERLVGPYTELNCWEASAMYLAEAGPKTTREIADALLAGGYRTMATDFRAVVRTMLNRTDAHIIGIRQTVDGKWYMDKPNRIVIS
ncbi:MAG TPA: hypothetical protein VGD79_01350 [Thermoanaerobaculia bacterium]|jgi:hypothetical protein